MVADPPYRVAYVIGELGKGGAEYQLYELLRHLDRRRFTPRVFVLAPGGWWVEPIRDLGVSVEEIPRRGPADVRRLARLRVALRRFAPHVVHTILWSGNSYGRLAALGLGIPVVVAAERNVIRRPPWQLMTERVLDRITTAYLVNCEAVAGMLTGRGRVAPEKIRVIPNGIDLGRLPPSPSPRSPRASPAWWSRRWRWAPSRSRPTWAAAASSWPIRRRACSSRHTRRPRWLPPRSACSATPVSPGSWPSPPGAGWRASAGWSAWPGGRAPRTWIFCAPTGRRRGSRPPELHRAHRLRSSRLPAGRLAAVRRQRDGRGAGRRACGFPPSALSRAAIAAAARHLRAAPPVGRLPARALRSVDAGAGAVDHRDAAAPGARDAPRAPSRGGAEPVGPR